jgi:acyl-CoA synthetase (NDP forming)
VDLRPLLAPASVAIVGASSRAGSIGLSVVDNLQRAQSGARIYPVNPKYDRIAGLECFQHLQDLPEVPDCVFIGVGAEKGPDLLEEAGQQGIRAAVLNATGYGSGGSDGISRLTRLQEVASRYGMAVCGPNNIGFMNVKDRVGMWTLRNADFQPGPVALITQSGTAAMLLGGDPYPLGLSYVITCGDEAVVTAADYLRYVVEDDAVQLVLLFLETIRDPQGFQEAANRAAVLGKKIMVLKVGRSDLGSRLVSAHTGAIAGEDEIYRALFRRTGVVLARDIDEMVQTARLVTACPTPPRSPGFVPITMSGGLGAFLADVATDLDLDLPPLSTATVDRIRSANSALGTPQNPLDAWGLAYDPATFPGVLDALLEQEDIGTVALCLDLPSSGTAEAATGRSAGPILAAAARRTDTRLLMINTNGQGTTDPEVVDVLTQAGIPCLMGIIESFAAIGHWSQWPEPATGAARRASGAASALPEEELRFSEASQLLVKAGLPLLEGAVAASPEDAVRHASSFGYPVVLKGMHPAVAHKSDAGLVHLALSEPEAVAAAFSSLSSTLATMPTGAVGAEIVVFPMASPGIELIAGVRNVPGFGSLLVLGLGGIYVEVLRKAAVRLTPIDEPTVRDMLAELSLDSILSGLRGQAVYDVEKLIDAVVALADFGVANQNTVEFIELNPLVVHRKGEGVVALDFLIEHANAGTRDVAQAEASSAPADVP